MGRREEAGLRNRDVERSGSDHVRGGCPHVVSLHGTPADAAVAAFWALIGRMAPPRVALASLMLRAVTDLIRPAHERAGE